MTKDEYINKIVCEHWYCLGNWTKGRKWNDKKKSIWLSGMHRAWNIFFPSDKIEPFEIVRKTTDWTREEAEQWYADYLFQKDKDDGSIGDRFEILDLRM